jgi:hypothetical protein
VLYVCIGLILRTHCTVSAIAVELLPSPLKTVILPHRAGPSSVTGSTSDSCQTTEFAHCFFLQYCLLLRSSSPSYPYVCVTDLAIRSHQGFLGRFFHLITTFGLLVARFLGWFVPKVVSGKSSYVAMNRITIHQA